MSRAKKYILISILVITFLMFSLCLFALNSNVANAEEDYGYYYVKQDTTSKTSSSSNVYFVYLDEEIFSIPQSYYIHKIGEVSGPAVPVSFMGLEGSISAEAANALGQTTQTTTYSKVALNETNAYPGLELTVSGNSSLIFEDIDGVSHTITKQELTDIAKVYYVGQTKDNKVFIKVAIGNDVYFGKTSTTFNTFSLSAHQEVINLINAQESGGISNQTNTNNSKALRVILIIGLIIPAVVIALLIFIPKKSEQYDKARMNSKKVGNIDYDKTRAPNDQQYQNGYNQYPPQQGGYQQPQYPQYQQPQYPPQNNGYYPPQQNNGYYPPQDNGYYPPQNGYYDPNNPNGGMQ